MRVKVRDQSAQKLLQLIIWMPGLRGGDHSLNPAHDPIGKNSVASPEHLRVIRRQYVLGAEKHLLVKLFARAHTRELDLDVAADRETRKTNQVTRDIHDPDRLTHVKQEYLAPLSQRSGLQYQLHCFRNGH